LVGVRVLAIDDDEQILKLVTRVMADAGHLVVATARESHEAERQAAAAHPDAIILDYELGGTTASELAPTLRAACPDAVLVGLSSTEPPDRNWCDVFMLKNDIAELARVVDEATRGSSRP
jgi:DNA-binding response OmpR family regulator